MNVPVLTLCCTGLVGLLCTLAPPLAAWLLQKKRGGASISFFCGCLLYSVVVLMLERFCNSLVMLSPLAESGWFTVLYSGLAAAVFAMVARLAAFSWLLKGHRTAGDAMLFGIGFTWCEGFIMLGADMLYVTVMATAINRDPALILNTQQDAEMYQALAEQLNSTPAFHMLAAGLSQLAAVAMEACLSILVMTAVAQGQRQWLWVTLALHGGSVALSVWVSLAVNHPLPELLIQLLATAAAFLLVRRAAPAWQPVGPGGAGTPRRTQVWNDRLPRR